MFNVKTISKMENERQTAGETATERTLVIFRDCHARNNIVITIESACEERFYRNFARRMGWPCTTRRQKGGAR